MKRIILKSTVSTKAKKSKSSVMFVVLLIAAVITVGTTAYIIRTQRNIMPEPSVNESPREIVTVPLPPETHISIPVEENPSEVVSDSVFANESDWQSDDVLPVADEEESEIIAVSVPLNSMISPVSGEILKPHSDTELVYSKTLDDWRLHKGIDISAPIGATVVAAAKGTVSECYTDSICGVTVIIDHENGIMTKYSNLSSTAMAEEGKKLDSGTVIGVVGDTAGFEIADESHLHFEVIKDGMSVNPEDYIK